MLRCLGIEMKFFCVTVLSLTVTMTVTIQSPFQADFNLTWSGIHLDDNSAESGSTPPQPKPRNKRQRAASVYIEAASLKAVVGAETKTLLHKVAVDVLDKKMYRLLAESCESQSERARSNALPVAPWGRRQGRKRIYVPHWLHHSLDWTKGIELRLDKKIDSFII